MVIALHLTILADFDPNFLDEPFLTLLFEMLAAQQLLLLIILLEALSLQLEIKRELKELL